MPVQCTCSVCGATFFKTPFHAARARYCSPTCSAIGRSDQVALTCDTCGVSFTKKRSHVGGQNYCSQACGFAAKVTRVVATCPNCGRTFSQKASEAARGRRMCSRACADQAKTRPTDEIFWSRVVKTNTCWLATGTHTAFGYRGIHVPKEGGGWRLVGMHIVAWFLATGEWPQKGQTVCHDCPDGDNPACVRNDTVAIYVVNGIEYPKRGHLWLGTKAANNADTGAKGRRPHRYARR